MPKTYVIGDIHGALRALEQVIRAIGLKKQDKLIFLGDYVDGWSESRQVIEYLMELSSAYECIFIKGNHDSWCEQWLTGETPEGDWLFHGGLATLESYIGIRPKQRRQHAAFFKSMRPYYEDGQGRLFIHAGFTSMHGPLMEMYEANYYWDRTLWEMALAVDKRIDQDSDRYPRRLLLYNEIYIGHTPTTNYDVDVPMKSCNVWNIDTGAAFRGRLSVLDIATKRHWQSEPSWQLYPGETGRNR